ncbi:arginine deiminase family protein [Nocardioides sp.]|uniref:dimethylarginine dimethylaminohydrolase family protein n=1 Tax=Nocardioides sp. TaxID=35761 RepID=UPI0025FA11D0|nr:arginine deiminase family protein [Nocardioides sp.]
MLSWGRHYVMVEPTHFRVDYEINPYMHVTDQPDPALAMHEWQTLRSTIERLGGRVDVLEQRPDAPDMVYAMNLGLGLVRPHGPHVVMSHMRYAQRRMESASAQPWFAGRGFTTSYVGRDGVGAHFEAGDAFPFGGELLVGYGPRTDELALKHLANDLGVSVRGFRIVHPSMYHFDLAFCPLDDRRALVAPSALDPASAEALLDLVPEPLVLTEDEELASFATNSIVIGSTIVMPACPDRVREQLEDWGFAVELVDVTEFHKGGGSIRCLTNPVDITVGRDLAPVDGGRVTLPPV